MTHPETSPAPIGASSFGKEGSQVGGLTKRQVQILRWIDENPSTGARWLVGDRDPKREPPSKWDHFEISGPNGSIRFSVEDQKAIRALTIGCASPDKLYSLNERGRDALRKATGEAQ